MFDGLQWHINASKGTNLAGPLASAVDDLIADYFALVGDHGNNATGIHFKSFNAHTFMEFGAMHTGSLGQGLGDVSWAGLAIRGKPTRTNEVTYFHERPHGFYFCL